MPQRMLDTVLTGGVACFAVCPLLWVCALAVYGRYDAADAFACCLCAGSALPEHGIPCACHVDAVREVTPAALPCDGFRRLPERPVAWNSSGVHSARPPDAWGTARQKCASVRLACRTDEQRAEALMTAGRRLIWSACVADKQARQAAWASSQNAQAVRTVNSAKPVGTVPMQQ